MAHTKGPWDVVPFLTPDKDDDPMMVYHVCAGDLQERFDNLPVNEDGEFDFDMVDALHEENMANARLIAAAPDLLAALINVTARCEAYYGSEYPAVRHGLAVIAKAKGVA